MKESENIYLIGMPGAGKSTLGKELARRLDREFVDLDDVIEDQMDMSIAGIFSELGEDRFRVAEKRALESVLHQDNLVVAVGGGTPCFFDNMDKMNKHGMTIFLDPGLDVLAERLRKDYKERPKLSQSTSLTQVLNKTYTEREAHYKKAQHVISLANPSAIDIQKILESKTDR